jgi:hypothetical protein
LGKTATKQEIWEISFYTIYPGSNLGVLEITDNPGQSFLSYNISFSFLFSFFLNFNNNQEFLDHKLGKY